MPSLRTVRVTHIVTPLREGGSLPAIVEADDEGTYVLKFRGAGQGSRALIVELVSGELARALGLPVPELVFADLHADLARTEPDPEISALIRASHGLNLALDYLPGSITFDPLVDAIEPGLASRIVWFDALVTNMDRTARNTNLLMWHKRVWMIDHGASLYAHHTPGWASDPDKPTAAFPLISNHVLAQKATRLKAIDEEMASRLTADVIDGVVSQIPLQWIDPEGQEPSGVRREDYSRYLTSRLAPPRDRLANSRSGHASTGWSPHAALSFRCRRCTPAVPLIRPRHSHGSWTPWSGCLRHNPGVFPGLI